jgi:hypothetical protein
MRFVVSVLGMQCPLRLFVFAFLSMTVLFSSCRHEELNTQRVRSLADIPAPNSELYTHVQGFADWRNPYLMVLPDGVAIQCLAGTFKKKVPVIALHQTLLSLPPSAWPYGRVVAVQVGGGPTRSDIGPLIFEQNRVQVEAILQAAGVVIDYWPGA